MTAGLGFLAGLVVWLLVPGPRLARLDGRSVVGPAWLPVPGLAQPRWVRWGIGLGVAAVVVLLLPDAWWVAPLVGVVAAFAAGYLPKEGQHDVEADEMPEALDLLAVCLEAGSPTSGAVGIVADVSPPATAELLRGVLANLEVGRDAEEAWAVLGDHPAWGLPARDLIRSSRSGTSLVASLRLHADDARIAARDRATKRARTVGVKSVLPLMACFLPAFVLVGVVPIIASLLAGFLG